MTPDPAVADVLHAAAGHTERTMLDRLHVRYSQTTADARRYAVAEHVANTTGYADRIADFIAVDCWPLTTGIHGHEVKVSRSDWLTELKQPRKAGTFLPYVHTWWVVAPTGVVRDDLPEGWGWMVPSGDGLRVKIRAANRDPEPMPREMTASLMRAIAATAIARAGAHICPWPTCPHVKHRRPNPALRGAAAGEVGG